MNYFGVLERSDNLTFKGQQRRAESRVGSTPFGAPGEFDLALVLQPKSLHLARVSKIFPFTLAPPAAIFAS